MEKIKIHKTQTTKKIGNNTKKSTHKQRINTYKKIVGNIVYKNHTKTKKEKKTSDSMPFNNHCFSFFFSKFNFF